MYLAQCCITYLTPAQPSLINQVTPTTLDKLSIYNFLITATTFYLFVELDERDGLQSTSPTNM